LLPILPFWQVFLDPVEPHRRNRQRAEGVPVLSLFEELPMSRWFAALSVAVLAGASLPSSEALAQEAATLKYAPALEAAATQQVEVEVKTDQTLTIAGMPLETHANTFLTMQEKVVGASSSGGWKFEGRFSLVQADYEFPGGLKLSFNSNNPDQADAAGGLEIIVDALKATSGAKWVAETDAEHQITKMEYVDDPFANVNEMLRGNTDPEAIKERRQMELERYPSEPVKPGDTWTRTEESDLGGGQTLTLEKEYTYAGSEERDGRTFDKVTVKALKVEYRMDENSASPAKVTDSELNVAESEGTYWYDRQLQAFSEVRDKVRMTGTLTMEINDQKLPGELDLTIESTAKAKVLPPE
jgi:hypothetical protein